MRYLLLGLAMMLSACEVVFVPDTTLPDPVVVHNHGHNDVIYVNEYQECYYEPPFYYEPEWCDYWADEVYCTYYVGYSCYEEWVHDPYCGWRFVDDWCVNTY